MPFTEVILIGIVATAAAGQSTLATHRYTSVGLNDQVFTSHTLFTSRARSVLHCAQLCSQQEFCATFTFRHDVCTGHASFVTSQTPHVTAAGARSFAWKNRDENCTEGIYGEHCSKLCDQQCLQGCDRVTGGCVVNVALGKSYSQISNYVMFASKHPPSKAANGDTSGNYDTGNCIHTDTATDQFLWWQVDLGQPFPVHHITVWERTGYHRRLFPFNITVDGRQCVTMTSDPDTSVRNTSLVCKTAIYGQVVRLTRIELGGYLNLCELQIFGCNEGYYGDDCRQVCDASCGGVCERKTGNCLTG